MKLLTVVVPSYNSEAYLDRCLSHLVATDELEVIIINDGSKDRTLEIARSWEEKYPNIIKVVDKENGGHGSGLNVGLELATGLYYKCCDSDDYLDDEGLKDLLNAIRYNVEKNKLLPDLFLADYVMENDEKSIVKSLRRYIKPRHTFTFKEIKRFPAADYIMMHNTFFKTEVLRASKVHLPEHTFYVDNVLVYQGYRETRTIQYTGTVIYHYILGRPDQSVSFQSMCKNWEHQKRCQIVFNNTYSYDDFMKMDKYKRRLVFHFFVCINFATFSYAYIEDNKQKAIEYEKLHEDLKKSDIRLYKKLRYRSIFIFSWIVPPKLRHFAQKVGYDTIGKATGWNM